MIVILLAEDMNPLCSAVLEQNKRNWTVTNSFSQEVMQYYNSTITGIFSAGQYYTNILCFVIGKVFLAKVNKAVKFITYINI